MITVAQRRRIRKRDNMECQFNRWTGIAELSGVPCSDEFEVHHITYKNAKENGGDGEKDEDLILMCTRCHDLVTNWVRDDRNTTQSYVLDEYESDRDRARKVRNVQGTEGQNSRH